MRPARLHAPHRPPAGAADADAGETLVAQPEPSPLYGAAKLVGHDRRAHDRRPDLRAHRPERRRGQTSRRHRASAAARSVDRVQRPAPQAQARPPTPRSACSRRRPTASRRRCRPARICPATQASPGPDGRCTNDAYVVSTDGRWRSRVGRLRGRVAGDRDARSQNGPAARRARRHPDRARARSRRAASLYVGKDGGAHWLWSAWQHLSGRELEFNDLGYLERKNDYQGYLTLTYRTLDPWWRTRETRDRRCRSTCAETLDGLNLWNEVKLVDVSSSLTNFWSFYFDVHAARRLLRRSRDRRRHGAGARRERRRHGRASGPIRAAADRVWLVSFDVRQRRRRHLRRQRPRSRCARCRGSSSRCSRPPATRAARRATSPRTAACRRRCRRDRTTSARRPRPASARRCAPPTPSRPSCRCSSTRSCSSRASTTARSSRSRSRAGGRVRSPTCGRSRRRRPPPPHARHARRATLNVNVVLRWEYRLGSTLFLVYTRAQNPALVPSPNGAELRAAPPAPGPRRRQRAHGQARLLVRVDAPRLALARNVRPRHSETAPRRAAPPLRRAAADFAAAGAGTRLQSPFASHDATTTTNRRIHMIRNTMLGLSLFALMTGSALAATPAASTPASPARSRRPPRATRRKSRRKPTRRRPTRRRRRRRPRRRRPRRATPRRPRARRR